MVELPSPQTRPGPAAAPNITSDCEGSVASYFDAFAPSPDWGELVWWPPDVFALANLVLDHTAGYRFVVAPPAGARWPPLPDWGSQVRSAGQAWRGALDASEGRLPELVSEHWAVVTQNRDTPLAAIRSGDARPLTAALLGLHAMADEACAGVAASGRQPAPPSFEARAWKLLQEQGSLSRISPTRVRVVPKTNSSARGITIRSLSRHLALSYEAVDVRWRSIGPGPFAERSDYNIEIGRAHV